MASLIHGFQKAHKLAKMELDKMTKEQIILEISELKQTLDNCLLDSSNFHQEIASLQANHSSLKKILATKDQALKHA